MRTHHTHYSLPIIKLPQRSQHVRRQVHSNFNFYIPNFYTFDIFNKWRRDTQWRTIECIQIQNQLSRESALNLSRTQSKYHIKLNSVKSKKHTKIVLN